MVQYYNLTKFSYTEGYMGFMQTMATLTGDISSIAVLVLIFVIPLMFLIRRGDDVTKSIHLAALYTSLAALFMYIAKWIHHSQILYICIMIYVITAAIRWYNRD